MPDAHSHVRNDGHGRRSGCKDGRGQIDAGALLQELAGRATGDTKNTVSA